MNSKSEGSGENVVPFSMISLDWKKAVTRTLIPGTYVLCNTAGYLMAENVASDDTGPATIICYDGHNAASREIWHDQALGKHGHGLVFKVPIYFDRGLTVVANAATKRASLQWIPGARL